MKVTIHVLVITSPTDGATLDVPIEVDPTDCTINPETGQIQTDDLAMQLVGEVTVHVPPHGQPVRSA